MAKIRQNLVLHGTVANKGIAFGKLSFVKRADIGSTSKAYAKAFLGADSPFDAITINPYFGTDGIKPFIEMAAENGKVVLFSN